MPEHLVSMITILLEEERRATSADKKYYGFQPCLEYFMHNKIMELLCQLGEKDVSISISRSF
jgi:hypothetical protein